MSVNTTPPQFEQVIILCPRFPEFSGGSVYVENMGRILSSMGCVSVVSIFRGQAQSELTYSSLVHDEALFKTTLRRRASRTVRGPFEAFPLWVTKRYQAVRAKRSAARLVESFTEHTLVLVTHVMVLSTLRQWGLSLEHTPATVIGQHHSPFASLAEEPHTRSALVREARTFDSFTALSDTDARNFASLLGRRAVFVPNPGPRPVPPIPRAQRPLTCVCLARMSHEKRLHVAVELFLRAIAVDGLDWHLHLYGDGEVRSALVAMVEALPRSDRARVHLHEPTDAALEVLSNARVNLITSSYEGFGMTALEAACVGTPTIAFDVSPGLRQLMQSLHGVLVPEGDADGFVRDLRSLMTVAQVWEEHASDARLGSQRYNDDNILERFESLAADAMGERGKRVVTGVKSLG